MTTRVLVCGGRNYDNYCQLEDELNLIERDMGTILIISGCARGADTLAQNYAEKWGDTFIGFPADWETYGRAAGPIRNQQMLDEGKPDLVIAFPGGNGTADMVRRAKKAGIEVRQINE